MTRRSSKQGLLHSLGARPVVADALDPHAVAQAVASAEREVIVHELIIGDGGGVFSHVYIEDAAAATALAVERGQPGIVRAGSDADARVRQRDDPHAR